MKLTGKILIVDDDESTLEFFDIMLSNLSFEVVKANNGLEALEKVRLYDPDLILLDNLMPKMTGFEVIQILKKDKEFARFRNTPIIVFSALEDTEDKVLGFEMGIDDYITKPFNFSEVLARIRNIIRHKELSRQLLKRERRLAILESLNTNLIAFTRHVKRPMTNLFNDIKSYDLQDQNQVQDFIVKYEEDYNQVLAMIEGLEEEIMEIETKGNKLKEEELSLEELEKKINKHLEEHKKNINNNSKMG